MTDDPRTICKRCGFANVPGDQFCGSCGAFLEWEGQPADAAAGGADATGAASPATPDPAAAAAGAAPASAAWGAPYGDPIPNPVRPSTPEPDTYDEDGDGVPGRPARPMPGVRDREPVEPDVLPVVRDDARRGGEGRGAGTRQGGRGGRLDADAATVRRSPARRRRLGAGRARAASRRSPASRWSACLWASRSCSRDWPCAAAPRRPPPDRPALHRRPLPAARRPAPAHRRWPRHRVRPRR